MFVKTSTPGRICLFGEHLDYLKLPVIAAAVSLRISIEGNSTNTQKFIINMPDIKRKEVIDVGAEINYSGERDYLKSSIKILRDEGYTFSNGLECEIKSRIPINAGASSSSALIVGWINFLACISDQKEILSPHKIAEYAHRAEVLEFGEPGGMMDHYSTSVGGIIKIESQPITKTYNYKTQLGSFVIGNSKEPKDTKAILARVKDGVITIVNKLKSIDNDFSLHDIEIDKLEKYRNLITKTEYDLLWGTLTNRDIMRKADKLLSCPCPDENKFGGLLYKHHQILRDYQKISTTKIDAMLEAAMKAGAAGAKINGSGGGGCMFAYAPDNTERVLEAVKNICDEAYIVNVTDGTKIVT